ncbi:BhlA/UviB family holin-like peptide [Alteribacter populi]|uniref:BhlA/UviB family holin-like peptide n=1 Tax=Alteribacter populi TaxID=2011011 RepID=UPI000BBB2AC2|nr:BhlA/UviB family holin-like peptide [Alteribacter populi]
MWEALIGYGIQTNVGIFGLLFIILLATVIWGVRWVMAMNNEREKRYIHVIDKQAESLKALAEIQRDVKEIKKYMYHKKE